jgi:hypothetical protein
MYFCNIPVLCDSISGRAQEQIKCSNVVESALEKRKREDYFRLIGKRLLYSKT